MPPPDAKATELARLKSKILEIEGQLREEKKITSKLRDNSEKKIQQSMLFDQEITSEAESFKWKREKGISDQHFLFDESMAKLRELAEKEAFYKHAMAEFDLVSYENERLHEVLKDVSGEQIRTEQRQKKERERKAQLNFDARIEMEEVHRHTILSFNNEYQKEAISKMELEASQANSENDRICTEFDIREARTNKLIRQQQASYEQLMHARVERDVLKMSVQMQEKSIIELNQQNNESEAELANMVAKAQFLRDEIQILQNTMREKNSMQDKTDHLKSELKPIQERCTRLSEHVTKLCHKLISEGLSIAKKERAFQSAQIAERIEGASSRLLYDSVPATSPAHSPIHSSNGSSLKSFSAGESKKSLKIGSSKRHSNTPQNSAKRIDFRTIQREVKQKRNHSKRHQSSSASHTIHEGEHDNVSECSGFSSTDWDDHSRISDVSMPSNTAHHDRRAHSAKKNISQSSSPVSEPKTHQQQQQQSLSPLSFIDNGNPVESIDFDVVQTTFDMLDPDKVWQSKSSNNIFDQYINSSTLMSSAGHGNKHTKSNPCILRKKISEFRDIRKANTPIAGSHTSPGGPSSATKDEFYPQKHVTPPHPALSFSMFK